MKPDVKIQSDVIQELGWDPEITQENIGVSVRNGIVTLSGSVPNYAEKFAAERAVRRIAGVKAVVENIEVKLPDHSIRDDQDIAEAILSQFKWNIQVPENNIRVGVEHGWVTLEGTVDWEFQRNAAEKGIRKITGVKGVINNVLLNDSGVSEMLVKKRIEEALKREAAEDAQKIKVEVLDHKVTLSGQVKSFAEMDNAKWAAWCAPGVTSVENKLKVNTSLH